MKEYMTISELVVAVAENGTVEARIVLNDETKDYVMDCYAENGMLCKVVSAYLGNDDIYRVEVDWNGYEEYNAPFEAHDWRLKDGGAGTMKEANMYPKDGIEDYYFDPGAKTVFALANNKKSALFKKWKESGTAKDYVSWLEDQVEL